MKSKIETVFSWIVVFAAITGLISISIYTFRLVNERFGDTLKLLARLF